MAKQVHWLKAYELFHDLTRTIRIDGACYPANSVEDLEAARDIVIAEFGLEAWRAAAVGWYY